MSSLVADTEGVDAVLDGVVARLGADVPLAMTHSEGLHLGSPLLDSLFLADSTFSVNRVRTLTLGAGRGVGWALVDDVIEVDLCWDVTSGFVAGVEVSTPEGRRAGRSLAQRKAKRIGELLTDRSGLGPTYPRRWNPRIEEARERLALYADGHVNFVVITLSMLFRRQERRGS